MKKFESINTFENSSDKSTPPHLRLREEDEESTVMIDNISFYVFGQSDGYALLLSKKIDCTMIFGESCYWDESDVRKYLNKDGPRGYLYDKPLLKRIISEREIYTRQFRGRNSDFVITKDKVFLLSEADVFGTTFEKLTARREDFSINENFILSKKARINNDYYWLRSCTQENPCKLAIVTTQGVLSKSLPVFGFGVRPACWVRL